ncbi:two-component regulator propeller domain-containing protein [Candidatus Latescibacterota bacterium]
MKRKILTFFVLVLLMLLMSCSGRDIPVQITQFTDLTDITGIAKLNNYLYCSTKGGLIKWDLATLEYTVVTTSEGLISNILTDIVIDNEDRIWVSSYDGLSMFDGDSWKDYGISDGLPSFEINSLTLDNTGNVWVSTQDGVAYFEKGNFKLLAEPGSPGRQEINNIFFDRGNNIWISSEVSGIFFKLEGEWKHTDQRTGLYDSNANFVAQSWDLSIWCSSNSGIFTYGGVGWHLYPSFSTIGVALANHIEASNKKLWFFTPNGVFSLYGSERMKYSVDEGLISNNAITGLVESDTKVFVGTDNGLSIIDNENITNLNIPNTPVGNNFISVAADDRGRIWSGTWETGVNLYDSGYWTTLTGENPKDIATVRSIVFGAEGTKMFNTTNGVIVNNERNWTKYTRRSGISGNDVRCGIFDKQGRYWIGTSAGISRLENGRWKSVRSVHGLPSEDVWACGVDSDDTVWFGTTKGIVSFKGDEFFDRTSEIGLDNINVRSILATDDKIYFGTSSGNLIVYENQKWDVFSNGYLDTNKSILAIASDPDGVLWLGTMGDGIIRLKDGKTSKIKKSDGLPSDFVRSVVYSNGSLWAACYGGVAKIDTEPKKE